jgi:hypothetical protein
LCLEVAPGLRVSNQSVRSAASRTASRTEPCVPIRSALTRAHRQVPSHNTRPPDAPRAPPTAGIDARAPSGCGLRLHPKRIRGVCGPTSRPRSRLSDVTLDLLGDDDGGRADHAVALARVRATRHHEGVTDTPAIDSEGRQSPLAAWSSRRPAVAVAVAAAVIVAVGAVVAAISWLPGRPRRHRRPMPASRQRPARADHPLALASAAPEPIGAPAFIRTQRGEGVGDVKDR